MTTLIINKAYMNLGGIETIVYNIVKYGLSQNYRIIWIAKNPILLFRGFEDIRDKIEIIGTNSKYNKRKVIEQISCSKGEKVVIISFTPLEHDFAIQIKERYADVDITPLYILANTKGPTYYIEEYFSWPLYGYVKKKMTSIFKDWEKHGDIRYFNHIQRAACEEAYHFKISDIESKKLPPVTKVTDYDKNALKERAKRKEFNIISISRFDFPHKRYLLGLVDAYAQLKPIYNQLSLYIIGYGVGEAELKNKIEGYPESISKDIHLLGSKTASEIDEIMIKMHLNVSVAGSVPCGNRNCVVSLPARNYCEDVCEVYGYLPESYSKRSSREPGMPVIPFIEELINMSDEEYLRKCIDSFETSSKRNPDPDYIFRQESKTKDPYKNHHLFFFIMNYLKDITKSFWYVKRIFKKKKGDKIA
jgi:hypothetical protein